MEKTFFTALFILATIRLSLGNFRADEFVFTIKNSLNSDLILSWKNYNGKFIPYQTIKFGQIVSEITYFDHVWRLENKDGTYHKEFIIGTDEPFKNKKSFFEVIESDNINNKMDNKLIGSPIQFVFKIKNCLSSDLILSWKNYNGQLIPYQTINPDAIGTQISYFGHSWQLENADGTYKKWFTLGYDLFKNSGTFFDVNCLSLDNSNNQNQENNFEKNLEWNINLKNTTNSEQEIPNINENYEKNQNEFEIKMNNTTNDNSENSDKKIQIEKEPKLELESKKKRREFF